jgi:kynurenine formamidase
LRRLIDLSHTVVSGATAYPGLPAPQIDDYLSFDQSHAHYAVGTEFRIGRLSMVSNTGTYLDTPAHRYRDGHDLSELPLEKVVDLQGVRVPVSTRRIPPEALAGIDVRGKAVLFQTGWSRHWRTSRYEDSDHPFVPVETAELLAASGAVLVGIDSVNIDDTSPASLGSRPAHSALLKQGVLLVEHLCNIEVIGDHAFTFSAVPVKIENLATFPVRAYAHVREE